MLRRHEYDELIAKMRDIDHDLGECELDSCDRTLLESMRQDCQQQLAGNLVYFVEAIGAHRIKVGFAGELRRRMQALATACPFQLSLLGVVPGGLVVEFDIHYDLRKHRVIGEWFQANPFVRGYIADRLQQRLAH